jgi:hypothetical protein
MKLNVKGAFSEEINYTFRRYEMVKWFILIFFSDILLPFLYDPFFIFGGFGLFGDVFFSFFAFFFVIFLYCFYTSESVMAFIQASFFYVVCFDWLYENFFFIFYEDVFIFLLGIVIFFDYFVGPEEYEIE